MQEGEYTVAESAEEQRRRRHPKGEKDWRYYLCCCSRSGSIAQRGKMVFLHGVLYLEIIEAEGLPDVDTSWFRSEKDVSDPYVTVDTCTNAKKTCRIAKTSIIYNSLSPHWEEKFRIEMCHEVESFLFSVKDMDLMNIECMGYMSIRSEDLVAEEPVSGWYPIFNKQGMPSGSLHVSLHYRSCESITRSNEVLDTVFPMREGCHVTLYQDAHTPALPPIMDVPGPDGTEYIPQSMFLDVANILRGAQKFIYIVGWSVNTAISLEREADGTEETLGELLKKKADEGVRVLVMVWNEALSTNIYTSGIMGTHDEDTRLYFDGTEVEVVLAPRKKNKGKLFETNFVSTCYTHHQKCVIADAEAEEEERRKLVAFVGGIDLTDGRWDTQEHPLFKTLTKEHQNDFYNGMCSSSVNVGPRQPWHDIHTKIEGEAVIDLIANFTERWRKQAPDREHRLQPINNDEFVLDWKSSEDSSWNVQFFRSINSDSALFDTDVLDRLLTRKGRLYENTIQRAYVHHIRRARRFIYIENQYFLGSSHGWMIQEAKCTHLIPLEIATRISNAIKAGEDFRVYIVIPLHPEGDPTSSAVQEILHWQHRTMEMMYRKVAKALRKVGSDAHPTDYLGFFCLTKRESAEEMPDGLDEPDCDSVAAKARQHMRFMIYVHSKMAIFDDEYVIAGSANINERSMNGNRDTEMAIGAYQPKYTKEECSEEDMAGDVRSFRLALWAEHVGKHQEEHLKPTSAECMAALRQNGEETFEHFVSEDPEHIESHLMAYPVRVTADGHVKVRDEMETFPDTNAPILGKNSNFLPNSLTT
ncbi:uncharacterized protein LOC143040639 isoform X2 [Oratosquilla oratoria]